MIPIGLVYSIYDSTEVAIQKMIDTSQGMLEIKTLENAPRDADRVRRLLQIKQRQKEEAMHIEDTQRLVAEIEMLKVVLYLEMARKQEK
jgi:hypothetical protein